MPLVLRPNSFALLSASGSANQASGFYPYCSGRTAVASGTVGSNSQAHHKPILSKPHASYPSVERRSQEKCSGVLVSAQSVELRAD
ncbi:hypothetical protein PF010_g32506 [Phytophthora fragariae]|uniref:Uncharacterized protein n=1 Tax=Phytophthora fragariae TaxID=53985 RepID=A0A6G0JEZ8_9STRA|nr:hypothetical protein PF010_g32506 [Phytophthora fragariae]